MNKIGAEFKVINLPGRFLTNNSLRTTQDNNKTKKHIRTAF